MHTAIAVTLLFFAVVFGVVTIADFGSFELGSRAWGIGLSAWCAVAGWWQLAWLLRDL